MLLKMVVSCLCLMLSAQGDAQGDATSGNAQRMASADLYARIDASPTLPFVGVHLAARAPGKGCVSGAVSGVAVDRKGVIYEVQRGEEAAPILVLDRDGRVLRSWGRGDFRLPHAIRIDPSGNVWTVDAAASTVIEYTPLGKKLRTIVIGGQPENSSPFRGATDIAFGPKGRLFITDGYGNARVLEYSRNGDRIRQWGTPGSGPGEFHLPHAIQIDETGIVYVADRENGRIERFDLDGHFLSEIPHLGRIYSLKLAGDVLWAGMGPLDRPAGSRGWVVKLDRRTGRLLGHLDVAEDRGGHAIEVMPSGEPVITLGDELLWFRRTGKMGSLGVARH